MTTQFNTHISLADVFVTIIKIILVMLNKVFLAVVAFALGFGLISTSKGEENPLTPQTWTETWHDHRQQLSLVFTDDQVAVYYDPSISHSITWPFSQASEAWKYVKETYYDYNEPSSVGPNPLLYVVLHAGKHSHCHVATFKKASHNFRNVMDCGDVTAGDLSPTMQNSTLLNYLITSFGHLIRQGANGRLNDADLNICGVLMREILSYDVYMHLQDPTGRLGTWKRDKMTEARNGIYWFRDWFLPIYENYGGAPALAAYYNTTFKYLPQQTGDSNSGTGYTTKLNPGEFVHFWSKAAGADLETLYLRMSRNSSQFQADLSEARKKYPFAYDKDGDSLEEMHITVSSTNSGEDSVNLIMYAVAFLGIIIITMLVLKKLVLVRPRAGNLNPLFQNLTTEEMKEFQRRQSDGSSKD